MPQLLNSIVAVDVETTGLHSRDRIVSLGAWRLELDRSSNKLIDVRFLHLIFDPGRKSHPRAEEVHGYPDWTLRHQAPFSNHLDTIRDFIEAGQIVVAHNASFDLNFIEREFVALGAQSPKIQSYCTMNAYRRAGLPGRASLNAICNEIGLKRIGTKHSALEDAWLALSVYLWLEKFPSEFIQPFSELVSSGIPVSPTNLTAPPPVPDGPLPRRRNAKADEGAATASVNRPKRASKKAIFDELRPTAILLLEVARSDNSMIAEEADLLTLLVRSASERLGIPVDIETEQELLSELGEIELTQNLLTRAARGVYENPAARDEFPKWFAMMAKIDGDYSDSKQEAVERVKAAIKRVLPEQ